MLPSELTNAIEQFVVCVHRNDAHFTICTYIYVYHTNVFETDNIQAYKHLPANDISPIFYAILIPPE